MLDLLLIYGLGGMFVFLLHCFIASVHALFASSRIVLIFFGFYLCVCFDSANLKFSMF